MPIRIEYTEDGLGVVAAHEGVVTGEMLKDAVSKVCKSERFANLKYWIGDRTRCTEFLPDPECLKKISDLLTEESKRNPGMLLALVSPRDIEFGMSRMFQAFAEKALFKIQVFRDRKSADQWIREELGME